MKERIKKIKKTLSDIPSSPDDRAFLPILLVAVSITLATLALVVNSFIYPFGGDLLSPIIAQIVTMLIPAYLCMLILKPEKSLATQLKELGVAKIKHEYVFFLIFTSLFVVSSALLLNVIFGGVYSASEGFTLLGTFTAGKSDYTVGALYLIEVYAVIPAVVEELVFRGIVYGELCKISEGLAICLSSLMSALFAFTLGGLPAALFCALAYCFVRAATGSLLSCVILHFIYNLFALFVNTNVSKYFTSSSNNLLLAVIMVGAWLVCTVLFASEAARVYRAKAKDISDGKKSSRVPKIKVQALLTEAKSLLRHTPTLVCFIVTLAMYAAIVLVRILV
jgi:membrane protease YdiL (CAAX protease family)